MDRSRFVLLHSNVHAFVCFFNVLFDFHLFVVAVFTFVLFSATEHV